MKHRGVVVQMRLNPVDVVTAVDVAKAAGTYFPGMSLAVVCKLAFAGLMEAARKQKLVPQRDEFDFHEVIRPFNQTKHVKKLQISNMVEMNDISMSIADQESSRAMKHTAVLTDDDPELDLLLMRKGRLIVKAQELQFQKDNNALNFTEEQAQELDRLSVEIDLIDKEIQV